MAKRIGKYKVSKKESELSLADGGKIDGTLTMGIQTTVSAAGPSTPSVAGVNILKCDTGSGNVTLGGLSGGVTGQIVHIIKSNASNNLVLENAEGDDQDFLLGGDLTFNSKPGGISCIYDGSNWIPLSHTSLS